MGGTCLYAAIAIQLNVRVATNQIDVAGPSACKTRMKNKEHTTCMRTQIHECEVGVERECRILAFHYHHLLRYAFGHRPCLTQNQTVAS